MFSPIYHSFRKHVSSYQLIIIWLSFLYPQFCKKILNAEFSLKLMRTERPQHL